MTFTDLTCIDQKQPALHGDTQNLLSKWESIPLPSPTIATKLSFVHLTGTNYIAPGKNAVGKSSLSTPPTLILEMPTDLSGAPQSRGILCVTRLSPVVCLLAFLYPYFADRNSIMLPRRFRASTDGERGFGMSVFNFLAMYFYAESSTLSVTFKIICSEFLAN